MDNARVDFHRLSFVPEGEDVVVGRIDTGSYAVLPEDGAALLRRLTEGMPTEDAEAWYESSYGEPVDMDDFLETMADLGFIRSEGAAPAVPMAAPRFQRLGRALFAPAAWIVYAIIFVSWLVLVSRHADLRPVASQIFFTKSLVLVQVTIVVGQIPLLFLHEGFHMLAGQRLGLASKLNISNRLTYVVFETQSNGLLSVPRRKRYLPFLAGMILDVQMICVLTLIAAGTRDAHGSLSFAGRLCLALSFTIVGRIGWQFLLYLRTDLYYVLATALNCHDLHEASKAIFFNRIRRWFGRTRRLVDESQWTDHDRRVGTWYGWLLMVGFMVAIGLTVFVSVPVVVIYVERFLRDVASTPAGARFWDALFSLALNAVQFGLPAYLARRKRRLDAGRKPRLLVDSGVV
jgi:hypothetical protein